MRLRYVIALAVLLIATASSAADPQDLFPPTVEPMPAEWVPEGLVDVHAAVANSRGRFFVVVRNEARTRVQFLEGGPALQAFSLTTGERGVLRPNALSAARAETDKFLGVALFAGRQQFTSMGGANVFGLEGGAALRILKQIDLTARYRMLSYDGRDVLSELQPEIGAPLLGFALRF